MILRDSVYHGDQEKKNRFFTQKKLMKILYVIVYLCCGDGEGASLEEFEIAAGTGCVSTTGKQLEKRYTRAWAGLC